MQEPCQDRWKTSSATQRRSLLKKEPKEGWDLEEKGSWTKQSKCQGNWKRNSHWCEHHMSWTVQKLTNHRLHPLHPVHKSPKPWCIQDVTAQPQDTPPVSPDIVKGSVFQGSLMVHTNMDPLVAPIHCCYVHLSGYDGAQHLSQHCIHPLVGIFCLGHT